MKKTLVSQCSKSEFESQFRNQYLLTVYIALMIFKAKLEI